MTNPYLSKMLYALTSAYNRKDYENLKFDKPLETNIGKLFSLFAWGIDEAKKQADLVKLWDNLDYAEGKVLDRYGANFGVKRITNDDRLYRIMIRVKMIAQISGGDTDTVIHAASELLEVEATDITYEDRFPAKIGLYVDIDLLSDDIVELIEEIAYAIKRILAAGIGMRLYLRVYRSYRQDVPLNYLAYSHAYIDATPVSQDRESYNIVKVQHGARQHNTLIDDTPNHFAYTDTPYDDKRGVSYNVRIKAKRID